MHIENPSDAAPEKRSVEWGAIQLELRRVADLSPAMVWITEPDGYCIHMSENWYEFTGREPGSGQGDGWAEAIHHDDRAQVLASFKDATLQGLPYHAEFRLCHRQGGCEWVISVGHPYFAADGQLAGYTCSDAIAMGTLNRRMPTHALLTQREREVVCWIAKGKTSSEVALILGIASRTVEQHATSAMMKFGTTNRVQTAVEALRRGEIDV